MKYCRKSAPCLNQSAFSNFVLYVLSVKKFLAHKNWYVRSQFRSTKKKNKKKKKKLKLALKSFTEWIKEFS